MTSPTTPRPERAPDDADARRRRLARSIVAGWLLACVAVIVAGSLVPSRWDLSPDGLRAQWNNFRASFHSVPSLHEWHEQRDVVTNVLFYMPLGLLVPWWPSGRKRLRRRLERCLLLLAGPLLSLAMESAQVLTRNRDPSAWDWAANSAGYLIGYGVAWGVIATFHLNAMAFLGERGGATRDAWVGALRLFYLLFFMLCNLLPMDLRVGLGEIWAKLHATGDAPALRLSPLASWAGGRAGALALMLAMLVPFGFFSALAKPRRGLGRACARLALAGAAWAALAEACRVFVASRSSDALGVAAGAMGGALGALLGHAWDRSVRAARVGDGSGEIDGNVGPDGGGAHDVDGGGDGLLLITLGWAAFLWGQRWWPFHFQPTLGDAWSKLRHQANWLPLRDYAYERAVVYFALAAGAILWWLPLGMLVGTWLARVLRARGWRHPLAQLALTLALIGGLGTFVEIGQCLTVDRVVDVTNILGHLVGALAGWLLARLLPRSQEERR
jgi:glycopeptide antibiotics resistance protein